MNRNAWISLLVVLAVTIQVARIANVSSRDGWTPFLSANDRSRWCTVASLVEDGTFEIDRIIELRDSQGRKVWDTIDKVQHRGADGKLHFYSSKPPLLSVLYAGIYATVYPILGMRLTEHPLYVGRLILVIANVVPLGIFWWLILRSKHLLGLSEWGQNIIATFLLFGTYLTTFSVTLSNHLPGALATGLGLLMWLRIRDLPLSLASLAAMGLIHAFAVTCELPALSWFAVMAAVVGWRYSWKGIMAYLVGAVPVAIAIVASNYWAHGDWRPAYDHRRIGPSVLEIAKPPEFDSPLSISWLRQSLPATGPSIADSAILVPARFPNAWSCWDDENQSRWILVEHADRFVLHQSDDWYDYPDSYWRTGVPRGVDRGEASRWVYAMHLVVGHHGILSLTPFWFTALLGLGGLWKSRHSIDHQDWVLQGAILMTTWVCIIFYLSRGQIDRNYGGVSCCFRWLVWMIPLWLLSARLGVESLSTRAWGRRFVVGTLAISVFSSVFSWSNPWSHPWLFQFWSYLGWIHYP